MVVIISVIVNDIVGRWVVKSTSHFDCLHGPLCRLIPHLPKNDINDDEDNDCVDYDEDDEDDEDNEDDED